MDIAVSDPSNTHDQVDLAAFFTPLIQLKSTGTSESRMVVSPSRKYDRTAPTVNGECSDIISI